MSFSPSFTVDKVVTNRQITNEFVVGNMGGMRRSRTTNTLVLISDHSKGYYDDKWFGDVLHYTGMGKTGDQKLESQNRTLFESASNGVEVHLFEVLVPTQYIYHGVAELAAEPYTDDQLDSSGAKRRVWIFPLKSVDQFSPISGATFEAYVSKLEKRVAEVDLHSLKLLAHEHSTKDVPSRQIISTIRIRDAFISEYAKAKARGVCQLCGANAPFVDRNGKPFLESHHITWLVNGGEDSVENTVALCPNCHRKMHILNDPMDLAKLMKKS